MSYSINFTDTAKSDLRDIAYYIAEQSKSKDVALKFIGELQTACNILIDFPNSGAYPKDIVLKSIGYRYIVHDEYLIFYSIDEANKTVYIQAVFNAKKDYMRVLKRFI